MSLSIAEKKRFRQIGHQLNPVVLLGNHGLTEAVLNEIDRALEDHELIKVRIGGEDREGVVQLLKKWLKQPKVLRYKLLVKLCCCIVPLKSRIQDYLILFAPTISQFKERSL